MMRLASVNSLLLLLMISVVPGAVGQRTGLIIGFGAAPGVTSRVVDPDVGAKIGAAGATRATSRERCLTGNVLVKATMRAGDKP